MRTLACLGAGVVAALAASGWSQTAPSRDREWPVYGGSAASNRYSPLREITPANVARLEEAWRFDTREPGGIQVNPIIVDGVLYSPTPSHGVVALDAATGALRWRFDSGLESRGPNRGVTYWAQGEERRRFASVDQYLYALDPATGTPIAAVAGDAAVRGPRRRRPPSRPTAGSTSWSPLVAAGRATRPAACSSPTAFETERYL